VYTKRLPIFNLCSYQHGLILSKIILIFSVQLKSYQTQFIFEHSAPSDISNGNLSWPRKRLSNINIIMWQRLTCAFQAFQCDGKVKNVGQYLITHQSVT